MTPDLIRIAHFLDANSISGILLFVAFLSFLLVGPQLMMSQETRSRKIFYIGIFGIFGAILSEFILGFLIQRAGWEEVKPRLFSHISSVYIDGVKIENPARLISVLRQAHYVAAHHSHSLAGHRVFMRTSAGPLVLDMARDAYAPDEYWIFNPTFSSGSDYDDIDHTYANGLSEIPSSKVSR
jgi:hypothetical protein